MKNEVTMIVYLLPYCFFALSAAGCQGSLGTGDGETDGEADGDMGDGHGDGVDVDQDTDTDIDPDVEIPPGCGDGIVGEGEQCDPEYEASRACTTTCGSGGTQRCSIICTWDDCEPPEEQCNGEDDDCDGEADNGFDCAAGSTEVCFEYCGRDVVRTCSETCSPGDCEVPTITCNEFIVPYGEDPIPARNTMVFSSTIRQADVYFLVDTTASMQQEISALKGAIADPIIAGIHDIFPDPWFGAGHFEDYPISPYGTPSYGDVSYENFQDLDPDPDGTVSAIVALEQAYGGDTPEAHVVALWTIATGDPFRTIPVQPDPSCDGGRFGYPCFREGSLPVIVVITDAEFHNGPGDANHYGEDVPAPSYVQTVDALVGAHVKIIGIHESSYAGDGHLRDLAFATGSVTIEGGPLVFNLAAGGGNIAEAVVSSVQTLAGQVPLEVTAAVRDDLEDEVDARMFVDRIEPNTTDGYEDPLNPGVFCVPGLPVADTDGDTFDDTFTEVLPGTALCFNIIPAQNDTVPSSPEPQRLRAFIEITGDGTTVLDIREIFFIVP
ncbi:MAG: hypothetical protein ABIJ56_03470 [Pseudomonadota bacterium]